MNINRDNYEMFFLLYVDKELSATERNAVDKFVEENIDLKPELQLLLQTSLPAEAVVFSSKNNLYKNEMSDAVLQESMLMHLDNELDPSSVNALEAEIAANDHIKQDWDILQKVKLDPNEKVVFENKLLLYRHEKNNVVSVRFWRMAVAAAIIGIGIFTGISVLSEKQKVNDLAAGDKSKRAVKAPLINVPDVQPKIKMPDVSVTPEIQTVENMASIQQDNKIIAPVKKGMIQSVEKNNTGKQLVKKETNNLPVPYYENINNQNGNQTIASNVQDKMKVVVPKNEGSGIMAQAKINEPLLHTDENILTETANGYAKNASLIEGASETGNDNVLFMNEEKVSHSKLGAVLRKVKRVVARNTNIKTGNSLKIAGFEIAVR